MDLHLQVLSLLDPPVAEPHPQHPPLKVGYSWRSLFGLQQAGQGQLSVVLQASGHEPSWINFGPSGRGHKGGHIEFGPNETSGHLQISVHSGTHFVAGGVISVEQLWQLAKTPAVPCHSPQRARTRRQSLADRLSKAFVGQSIAESDPMYGNVWVYVADEKDRRYGSVLACWTPSRPRQVPQ